MIPNHGGPSPVIPSAARRPSNSGTARASAEHQPTASPNASLETDAKKAAELQMQWNEAICRNMEIPEGYAQVAVLIIKWAESLDDMNCSEEAWASQLHALFRDSFHYETKVVQLNEKCPQHQLRGETSSFLQEFDGPNNLLIIYYTGHSVFDKNTGDLEFYARKRRQESAADATLKEPRARWKNVETPLLEDTQADTLAILDTCFASNVNKGGEPNGGRVYHLLAASGPDKQTAAPGVKSFTTALIESLKECVEDEANVPFTLWKLSAKINEKRWRRQNPSHYHDRLKQHNRQILLAPLNQDKAVRAKTRRQLDERVSVADLTLRFGLKFRSLNKEHIEQLTKAFPRVCREAGVKLQKIDWVSFEERPVSFVNTVFALRYAGHWLRVALPNRARRSTHREEADSETAEEVVGYQPRVGQTSSTESVSIQTEEVHVDSDTGIINANGPRRRNRTRGGDGTLSVNTNNIGFLAAAVVGGGVLSCLTTMVLMRASLKKA